MNRYRLSGEEIVQCCEQGYDLGFRTFVLQGGEDPYYDDARMVSIVSSIREAYPGCAITLSIGERSEESYRALRAAGADRYLLRHETADPHHYDLLHPNEMSLTSRKKCLMVLRSLGYQVGSGFMVGSPGQTARCLAEDMVFLQELANLKARLSLRCLCFQRCVWHFPMLLFLPLPHWGPLLQMVGSRESWPVPML